MAAGRRVRSARSPTRLGTDERFYAGLRNGSWTTTAPVSAPAALTSAWRRSSAPGTATASWPSTSRSGCSARARRSALAPLGVDHAGLSDEMRDLLASVALVAGRDRLLWFAPPEGVAGAFPHAHDLFINTMWESRPASARLGGDH